MAEGLDWNDLRYFLAVARAGGLTPAATSLRTSASTVSRHIDAMEARLGVRLFLRQQRGYLLTDQGSALFERVAEVELAMHAVERNGAMNGEAEGLVKLAAPESLAVHLIAPELAGFTRRHPKVQVELVVSRHMADLSRREADLALRIVDPERHQPDPDSIAHHIGILAFGLYATPALLAQFGSWQELPHIAWDDSWIKLPVAAWMTSLFPNKAPVLRANSVETQYAAALGGLGAAMLPRFFADQDRRLQGIEIPFVAERELWLLYHRDLRGSQRVQVMREFLAELVGQRLGTVGSRSAGA